MSPEPSLSEVSHPGAVRAWLWGCVALCAAMVLVGGVTRLTGSGLSITEWNVVTGVVPPLSPGDWEALFARYRQSPQYHVENAHFGLGDFQRIFWWEWAHRLLGRVVGLTYLAPYLWFWRKKDLEGWLVRRGLVLIGLVAFQGVLGWVMVKSGLVDRPHVSHFRLAAHLVTALLTLALTAWTALRCRLPRTAPARSPATAAWLFIGLLTLQVILGAFVAGLRAGLFFNTFPTMGGVWVSPLVGELSPWWRDLVENPATVQLLHRWCAVLVVLAAGALAWASWRVPSARRAGLALGGAALLQFSLGVGTLLFFHEWPVLLGSLHQLGAVGLLVAAVGVAFTLVYRAPAPAEVRPETADNL